MLTNRWRNKKRGCRGGPTNRKRTAAAEPHLLETCDQLAGGGLSPVFSTVFSVVVVVSPPGVVVVVSVLVAAFSAQPVNPPSDTSPVKTTKDRTHFIEQPFDREWRIASNVLKQLYNHFSGPTLETYGR